MIYTMFVVPPSGGVSVSFTEHANPCGISESEASLFSVSNVIEYNKNQKK